MAEENSSRDEEVLEMTCAAKGRMKFAVVVDGEEVADYGWKDNVILDQGLDRIASASWASNIAYLAQGLNDTPAATNQTGLIQEYGTRSNTYPNYLFDDGYASQDMILVPASAIAIMRRTIDGVIFASGATLKEFALSHTSTAGQNTFNRVVPNAPVVIPPGGQPRITYELSIQVPGVSSLQPTVSGGSTGWPYEYTITNISSTSAYFDVTLNESHHYLSGGKINILDTTNYNGEYTIYSIPNASSFRVLDINEYAGESSGKAKNNVKRKFVAVSYGFTSHTDLYYPSNPANNGVGMFFGTGSPYWQNVSGVGNNITPFDGTWGNLTSWLGIGIKNISYVSLPTFFPSALYGTQANHLLGTQTGRTDMMDYHTNASPSDAYGYRVLGQTYIPGSFYMDYIFTFGAAVKNFNNINAILVGQGSGNTSVGSPAYFLFEEPQRKKNTHTLTITIRRIWGRM